MLWYSFIVEGAHCRRRRERRAASAIMSGAAGRGGSRTHGWAQGQKELSLKVATKVRRDERRLGKLEIGQLIRVDETADGEWASAASVGEGRGSRGD